MNSDINSLTVYMVKMTSLKGAIALVTGAGRGFGKAFAEKLLEKNCKVYI